MNNDKTTVKILLSVKVFLQLVFYSSCNIQVNNDHIVMQ